MTSSWAGFSSSSTLGFINPDLSVTMNPAIPGNGAIIHTLGNIGPIPVNLDAQNTYYGLYAIDTFDLTSQLSLTLGGRLNVAKIKMADLTGVSPDLNNDLTYTRLNPLVGLDLAGRSRPHSLWRLLGVEPRPDAARDRVLQSGPAVPDRKRARRRSAAQPGRVADLEAGLRGNLPFGTAGSTGSSAPTAPA